uniref:Uncharacterized protein n=1 Tax=Meloidogyne enterolobii TaxID=390850 RepID=A0A6V7WBZ7_MELEN|nr:unnamed protein product [Meloidogyne enterolobii]
MFIIIMEFVHVGLVGLFLGAILKTKIKRNLLNVNAQKRIKTKKAQPDLTKCKKCRLDKCLFAGMKKLVVGYIRKDTICRETMEGQKNEINILNPIVHETIKDQSLINSILPIIEAKKRIMHAFNDLDDIFLNGPILFEEIILSNFNIFRLTDTFSPNPSPIPFDELNTWESSLQRERLFNSRVQKCFLVDRLLCFSIANSMPVFEKLTLSDKHTSYLFTSFTRTYLAWELGSETWMRKNNIKPALVIMKNIVNDDKMIKWSDYVYTKSVVHFKRVALTEIEFALLIAIIFTKSNAKGLSPEGKELLLDESIKYTNILLRYNQRRLGLIEGAQRLDECCRLINRSIENEYTLKLMLSHQQKYYSMSMNYFKCSNFMTKFWKEVIKNGPGPRPFSSLIFYYTLYLLYILMHSIFIIKSIKNLSKGINIRHIFVMILLLQL